MTGRVEGKKRWCISRLRKHSWVKGIDIRDHRYKVCSECGRRRMTHHVSCSPACAFGPG